MTIRSFRDLIVWQLGRELVKCVYELTKRFPREEQFGLTSQVRRAAVSIPSNIAEGHARESTKEFLYHLSVAMGSLAELETQLHLASDLNYCDLQQTTELLEQTDELGRKLRGLQKSLHSKS